MKGILVACMLGLIGCAGNKAVAPKQVAVVAPRPSLEELKAKADLENDRTAALALVNSINDKIQSQMKLPSGMMVNKEVAELVFADDRRVAVVTLKVSFKMANTLVDQALVTFILARKNPDNEWEFKGIDARPTPEILKLQQQRGQSQEESNGTEL